MAHARSIRVVNPAGRLARTGLVSALLLGTFAPLLAFDSFSQLRLHNNTGETLLYVFVSPAAARAWGVDIVADQDGLGYQASLLAFLLLSRGECAQYDILARSERGRFFLLRGQELCGGWNELRLEADTILDGRLHLDLGRISVHNETPDDILFLYTALDRPEFMTPSVLRAGRELRSFGTAELYYAHDGLESLYMWALDSGSGVHEIVLGLEPGVDEYELILGAHTRER